MATLSLPLMALVVEVWMKLILEFGLRIGLKRNREVTLKGDFMEYDTLMMSMD